MQLKGLTIGLLLLEILSTLAGQTIIGEKEVLARIPIGMGRAELNYRPDREGLYGPSGPFVGKDGTLYFIDTTTYERLQTFRHGLFLDVPFPEGWPDNSRGTAQYQFRSQQANTQFGSVSFVLDGSFDLMSISRTIGLSRIAGMNRARIYDAPWGFIYESGTTLKKGLFSIERTTTRDFIMRDTEETRTWLAEAHSQFSIGGDGYLYKDGYLWSAIFPSDLKDLSYSYLGRIASGHVIWAGGQPGNEKKFAIASPSGKIELSFLLPWAPGIEPNVYSPFTYCLGPWGELYALIAPKRTEGVKWDPAGGKSELVVLRTYLKEFGRLNDSNVNLRQDPSTTAEILGTYPVKTGFRIIEKSAKQDTIGGKKDYWYHVRLLNGKEGWFFGAFVSNLYDGPGTPPPWPNIADW